MSYFNRYIPVLKLLYPSYLYWHKPRTEKNIYLTFDDGPVPEVTEFVLDCLKQFEIKATFFCVGENVSKHPEIFKKILEQGHSVGNHTYNHLKGWQTNDQKYHQNIALSTEVMQAYGGATMLFRPPYGKAKRKQLHEIAQHYQIVMWDVLTGDFDHLQSPEDCLQNAIQYTKSGSIVIFHDSIKAQKNLQYALPHYIAYFLKKGFHFKKL
jgi:peptidoglycan/xylan/chitin deacetylase (PgdA/CDA1 family)